MKININFDYKFPKPTFTGCCYAAVTFSLGFLLKTFYDYLDSKRRFLEKIEKTSLELKDKSQDLSGITDAISYANQVGRLDLVSLLLAGLGIIIGFSAIFGFLHVKDTSEAIARDVARETAENHLRKEDLQEKKNEIISASKEKIRNKKLPKRLPKNWAAEVNK